MSQANNRSLKKNAVLNTFKTFLSLCFPLITFPYSSRVLGPEKIGMVQFAQSIVSYFAIFASLGITTYAVRETSKARNDQVKFNTTVKEIINVDINDIITDENIEKLNTIPIYVVYMQYLEKVNEMINLVKDELNDYFVDILNN